MFCLIYTRITYSTRLSYLDNKSTPCCFCDILAYLNRKPVSTLRGGVTWCVYVMSCLPEDVAPEYGAMSLILLVANELGKYCVTSNCTPHPYPQLYLKYSNIRAYIVLQTTNRFIYARLKLLLVDSEFYSVDEFYLKQL